MFGIPLSHERHCIDIFVAFALIPDAATIIPATFTSRKTESDFISRILTGFVKSN